jgi:DNA modification methylase
MAENSLFPSYKTVATADLIPYARNARTHSDAQVAKLAASIREFGFLNPIITDGKNGIVAGHGRVMAAQKLGLQTLPVIEAAHLTAAQKRAYILADNRLALDAGWDNDMLKIELGDLQSEGFDLALTGFDLGEVAGFLDATEGLTDPDAVPDAPEEPVTVSGDVWIMGRHRLMCGDSTDALVADRLGVDECAMLLSDPPYGLGYEYAEHDDNDNGANAQLVADAFKLGPESKAWTPGLNNLARDIARFGRSRIVVWNKGFSASGNGLGGASTWEPIIIVGRTPEKKLKNDVLTVKTDRIEVDNQSLRKLHPCPKPVALYEELLIALTKTDQTIYEPFSGSGTTIIACEKTGRKCRAIEITPAYVDVAVKRWQEFTGQFATLEGDGRTFDEVAQSKRAA